MFSLFRQFFDFNEREVRRLQKKVVAINALEDKARELRDEEFAQQTKQFKEQIAASEKSLDDILPWAYVLVREASRRVLGQRHFDEQLMAGIALHEGKISEQKTGEGKTLSATTALYLNALTGKGAHLVTVNDYLARRDAGWMGRVYHLLGIKTAAIIADASFLYDPTFNDQEAPDPRLRHLRPISRKEAYDADITYGINSEFGFDYLRDNMAQSADQFVQRGFHFAIVDEADSVLIDEARTPHIISAPYENDVSAYYQYARIARQLVDKEDYVLDEKLRTVHLTDAGISKVETALDVSNIYEKDFDTLFHIEAALKAVSLFKIDKDYIVRNNEVVIVDEFTGRLLEGRRFSEGLHQAIEAKEGVSIKQESRTLATVSLQNYFRLYEKLGGMTGTAATESEEFHKIYKTDVIVIPTHRPMVRKDHADMIYKTEHAKANAIADAVADAYRQGRPVLVGTTSIEKNEHLSRLLERQGVPHEVLNAKNHEREAQIIAKAGEKGSVTVATNMAGRGVDIILGGQPLDPHSSEAMAMTEEKRQETMREWQARHDEVVSLGGLLVVGTERHESRRIDNQLRGRAGRQGDPGDSRFFVSLEDDLMRIFGGEQISRLMTFFNFPEDQPLSHPMVSRAIEQAQVKVEGFNFDIRKHLVEFDDVLNKQREILYTLRRKILLDPEKNGEEFDQTIAQIVEEEVVEMVASYFAIRESVTDEERQTFEKDLQLLFPVDLAEVDKYLRQVDQLGLQSYLVEKAHAHLQQKEAKVGQDIWRQVIRSLFLSTIDQFWTQHLTAIEDLREGINLRGYAQLDPLVEYKNDAFQMFEQLVGNINYEGIRRLMRVEVEQTSAPVVKEEERPMVLQSASSVNPFTMQQQAAGSSVSSPSQSSTPPSAAPSLRSGGPAVRPHGKIGRNDPCWCGSGKKYKKCHWPN